jgi:hypothetical protein
LASCQRARRRLWQKQKPKDEVDYRLNQAEAQRVWAEDHADYWRRYRAGHPEYADENRAQRRRRDARRRAKRLAKMDAITGDFPVRSGIYRLLPSSGVSGGENPRITGDSGLFLGVWPFQGRPSELRVPSCSLLSRTRL